MDPHPDSALALLDTLHAEPQHYTAKDRARYYLLLTEAEDKCFLTHTTDTLIRFSAEYYEQHNDRHHYAKALYLQGRIYENWRKLYAVLRERMGFMKNTFKRGEFGQHVRSMSLNLPYD